MSREWIGTSLKLDVENSCFIDRLKQESINKTLESLVKFNTQYVTYHVTFQDTSLSQSVGGRSNITHEEKIVVEFGYHDAIETLLNKLASKAGSVKAAGEIVID